MEALNENNVDYTLQKTARFAHSESYINQLAVEVGFNVIIHEKIILRYQDDTPVYGWLIILGINDTNQN